MPTVDYKSVAAAVGANVDTQADFVGSGYQLDGFTVGVAQPAQANKVWRQSSVVAAALANYVSEQLAADVLDDGNVAALTGMIDDAIEAQITAAIAAIPAPATTVGTPTRSLSVVYQNTSGLRMMVKVTVTDQSAITVKALVGTTSPPTVECDRSSIVSGGGYNAYTSLTFIAPPSSYYKVLIVDGTPTLTNWVETTF